MTASLPPYSDNWALFLDADGTLLDFADAPHRVALHPNLRQTLARVHAGCAGALALISGRQIDDLDQIFAPLRLPAAGLHGHERRDPGGRVWRDSVDGHILDRARGEMRRFADRHPGVLVEDKALAVALHVRQAPRFVPDAARLAERIASSLPTSFELQSGKMVFEVKPNGESKGTAIAALMDDPVFANRVPVFVGDDATDEDGFRWVNEHRGITVKVGPGRTAAGHRLADIDAVAGWLDDYATFLESRK